ncbi:hypothetical protein [Campylobacter gastrosuis]|uniref:DNA adenine methylase n=2 Tax=Campylobacter gastrosuis TaxID=2974576 RepID=A0ABT7HT23_9BACT|nr:hypothetical protein [Campylobacter gastrosuis]MDL0090072.1 hypothetical protein [Campylobacter gastrosuis]
MNYIKAPLPFLGQKRNFLKAFKQTIKEDFSAYKNATFVDVFGGSGLLANTIKSVYPNARVIYNDFDGYTERLKHIDTTNEILEKIAKKYNFVEGKRISDEVKQAGLNIIKDYENKGAFIDYITISSFVLFSGNYAKDFDELKKYNWYYYKRATPSKYSANGYLNGAQVVRKDGFLLIKEFLDDKNAVLVLDPPYLNSLNDAYLNRFWGVIDFLKLVKLMRPPYLFFSSHKSQIMEFINLEIEILGTEVFKDAIVKKTNMVSFGNMLDPTDYMIYKSGGVNALFS